MRKHFHLSQQLLPLMDPTIIKREDTPNTNIDSTQDPEREKDEHDNETTTNTVNPTLAIPVAVSAPSNADTTNVDIQIRRTTINEKDEQTPQTPQPITDNNQEILYPYQHLPCWNLRTETNRISKNSMKMKRMNK